MTRKCLSCGKDLANSRSNRKTCSATCRTALFRGSKRMRVKCGDPFGEFWVLVPRKAQWLQEKTEA